LVKLITTKEKGDNIGAFTTTSPLPVLSDAKQPQDGSMPNTNMKGIVEGVPTLNNKDEKHVCKVGDKILFNYGNPLTVDGVNYMIVSSYDIKLIL